MRRDINKVFAEPARRGSSNHFNGVRHCKKFDDEATHESMKHRYKHTDDELKGTSENWAPIEGWLHKNVGRKWDDVYSELHKTVNFSSKSGYRIKVAINYLVEQNAVLADGKVMVLVEYSRKGYMPVDEVCNHFYVCPKDRTLRKARAGFNRKAWLAEQETKKQKEKETTFRVIDKYNHLHLIDGIWFHFTLKDLPVSEVYYSDPSFHWIRGAGSIQTSTGQKTWEEMSGPERARYGAKHYTNAVKDVYLGRVLKYDGKQHISNVYGGYYDWRESAQRKMPKEAYGRYYNSMKTASKKILKQAGVNS